MSYTSHPSPDYSCEPFGIGEWTSDVLIEDIIGILLQYGNHGGFVERSLMLWKTTNDFELRRALKVYYGTLFRKFNLTAEYKKILDTNATALKVSTQYMHQAHGHNEIFSALYGPSSRDTNIQSF